MIRDGYDVFLFCMNNVFILFYNGSIILGGFSVLLAFSFSSSVLIVSLLIIESFNCCLISSLLNILVFLVFSEPFLNCKRKKLTTKQKNLKHLLQTKNALSNLILRLY